MLIAGVEMPDDLLYLVEHQTWARVAADGTATVGITALGLKASGEIYMCRPKSVGSAVEQGRSMAVVELSKSIVSVKSPLSGEVLAVNGALEQAPELVYRDPYGAGWLLLLRPSRLAHERQALLGHDNALAHHTWLNQQQP